MVFLPFQVFVRRVIGDFFVTGKGVVGTERIGQHQHVPVALMFEIIVDALLLHEPADEVEIGFPVLDAVVPGAVSTTQRLFEIGEPMVPEHLLDNIRDGHLLENPAVGGAGQKPQPGPHGHVVGVEIVNIALLTEAAHESVEIACLVLGQFELDGDVLPQQLAEVERGIVAEQIELELKQAPERFGGGHAVKQQNIVAQRGNDLYRSFGLYWCHGSTLFLRRTINPSRTADADIYDDCGFIRLNARRGFPLDPFVGDESAQQPDRLGLRFRFKKNRPLLIGLQQDFLLFEQFPTE